MKYLKKYIVLSFMACYFMSCHDLEVVTSTQITPNVFPKDSLQYLETTGPAYAALRGNFSLDYWFMQSLSTDEAILPARGTNWYDNQNYRMLHYHDWTKDHGWTGSCWTWLSRVVGVTNQTISIVKSTQPDSYKLKKSTLAELKMVRAIAYFMMMDLYGNIPLDTVYGDFSQHPTTPRADVFSFLETEIKSAIPNLSDVTGITTYGRPTKYAAYALLAKMYINSSVYTGVDRFNECIAMCDNIIGSGKFALEPMGTYLKMFYPTNGPTMKEFIFAIPYDPTYTSYPYTNGFMYHGRYDIPRSLKAKFNLAYTPSAPESTIPEFYAYYNDLNDVRNGQWLTGLQFLKDGTTPVNVTVSKQSYDYTYNGADKKDNMTYQVNITPDILLRLNPAQFDCGNDEIAWNMGYRNIKFYPDDITTNPTNRNQSNDAPFLRYSDIILMKAEAILRGGSATSGDTPLALFNLLRSNRTTSAALSSVTLDDLYAERTREFSWETWHRNDMIRFGKFEGSWGFKTNADTYRRIFPIPTVAFASNKSLTQNPGY